MTKLNFGFIQQVKRQNEVTKQTIVNGFDSAAAEAAKKVMTLDDKAFNSEFLAMRKNAIMYGLQLVDDILEDNLEDAEIPSDRLDMYLTADLPDDDDEESSLLNKQMAQIMAANMSDLFIALGVDEDTIADAFGSDIDNADLAISEIAETVISNLPQGDALDDFIQDLIYGEDEDVIGQITEEYDAAQLGKNTVRKNKAGQTLVYRGIKAVRKGKITVVNKRIGSTGKIKLSPKQKAALRKAAAKAIAPNAIKRRVKSLAIGHKRGIYKQNRAM